MPLLDVMQGIFAIIANFVAVKLGLFTGPALILNGKPVGILELARDRIDSSIIVLQNVDFISIINPISLIKKQYHIYTNTIRIGAQDTGVKELATLYMIWTKLCLINLRLVFWIGFLALWTFYYIHKMITKGLQRFLELDSGALTITASLAVAFGEAVHWLVGLGDPH